MKSILSNGSLLIIVLFLAVPMPGYSELYKYKDDKGVWHFTDSPSDNNKDAEKMASTGDSPRTGSDLLKILTEKIKPRNKIENASLGTVVVKTPMGTGSGFFVSDRGFIVTNRHVLYGDEKMIDAAKKRYEHGEALLDEYKARLDQDKNNLEAAKNELEEYKAKVERISNPDQKASKMRKYEAELARVESYEREFNLRKAEYERVKDEIASGHSKLSSSSASSGVAKSFEITLADGSLVNAELVEVSKSHDLALLKLSGYKNFPALSIGSPSSLAQSSKVYAIGNPINLHNSVADGIISGFQGDFVKTSAKIYPGNSGGPLVDAEGRVIGVNTMKEITHKFEGLGFAIRIDIVMSEFASYLN